MKDKYVIQIYKILDEHDDIVHVQERYEYFTWSNLKDITKAIKSLYGVTETFNYNKWKKTLGLKWGFKNENNDNQPEGL